ncbi:MAG: response regulator transcription factor [Betaproteobacteria bacterium]|nr:response regulator transcription factor [Betaproteobacteria bacterium]
MNLRILVVDDDAVFAETLATALSRRGHVAVWLQNPVEALTRLKDEDMDAVVLDLRLGAESGLRLIAPLRAARPNLRLLLLTGYASIATAVEAIKLGATHYLPKPATVDEILNALGANPGNAAAEPAQTPLSVDRLEWEHIQKVLSEHDGNLSATARALKMHRRTLQRKLAKRPVRA